MTQERTCGTCTLCCKVLAIKVFDKPPGQWCAHCAAGTGCKIYPERPPVCIEFSCDWIRNPQLGPEWKPEKSRFVLVLDASLNTVVHVDPGMPNAWRRPPYYETLKRMMASSLHKGGRVFINSGGQITVLLPDGEHKVGKVGPHDSIVTRQKKDGARGEFEVIVKRRDAPEVPLG